LSDDGVEVLQRRAAANQSLFRVVNERLKELNASFEPLVREAQFVCECARLGCIERVTMTVAEYEDVRRMPNRFIVKPGPEHFLPAAERIVDSDLDYLVVEKLDQAGTEAAALDPRSTHA